MFNHDPLLNPGMTDPDRIRELARDKGYVAERALREGLWRLIRPDGCPELDPVTRDTGFSYLGALDFLEAQPDAI